MRTRRPCLLSASRRGVISGDKGHDTGLSPPVNTLAGKIRESSPRVAKWLEEGSDLSQENHDRGEG